MKYIFLLIVLIGGRADAQKSWPLSDTSIMNHAVFGTDYLFPTSDGSYLEITNDSTFVIHGNINSILTDLWKRQNDAWEAFEKMSQLRNALIDLLQTVPDFYTGKPGKFNKAFTKYKQLMLKYKM